MFVEVAKLEGEFRGGVGGLGAMDLADDGAADNAAAAAAAGPLPYHHLMALHHQHLLHQQMHLKDEFANHHLAASPPAPAGTHSRASTPHRPPSPPASPPRDHPKGRGRKRAKFYGNRDANLWPIDGSAEMFGSKAELQLHSQLHMREAKPYKCSQCTKAFANSSYLSQHTRIHLGIKPYRCEICQRKFTQLSHLQQHIRTHTGDKPYKCRHVGCNKAFSQLSNLQSHSRCHQTDKPYKCNSCYKCFTDEPSLLEHIPKHKESKHLKTHICQYCGKSYTQETYLSKHMQKHAERQDKRPPIANSLQPQGQPQQQPQQQQQQQQRHSPASDHAPQPTDYWAKEAGLHETTAGTPTCNDLQSQQGGYEPAKTTSAFTPIQASSMLPLTSAAVASNHLMAPPSASRGYHLAYDSPLSFPKANQLGAAPPTPASVASFPNQLISLSQIRNYQPAGADHLHGLKDK